MTVPTSSWIVAVLLVIPSVVYAADSGKTEDNGFTALDTDNNGRISRQEAVAGQAERFGAMDRDGDGKLERKEYRRAMAKRYGPPAKMTPSKRRRVSHHIDTVFNRLDQDDSGAISLAEYQQAMSVYFERLDRNHDGELDPGELKRALGSPEADSNNGA